MVFQYAINMEDIVSLDGGFLNLISNGRKKKISRFYFMKDKIHCLLAEVLLRYALWTHYNLEAEQIKFRCTDYGKPYLVDKNYIYFNLSHSCDWVMCVLGDRPLGIDVEKLKRKDLYLAKSIYSQEEYQYLLNQSQEKMLKSFFKIWTLKESYVKYKGQGLSIPFDSFFLESIKKIYTYM
ncbi:4'-phosphopantetheinyl transferase family protein [Clostridium beijerinckii]|uniref:4'-phosphopantetheinyl transferase n=2 Tax=Clostridium beijerinckii TaxID=1520 RepID=A0AAE5LQ20_CLOBE|nr:4'-phosphopantetheinyl transferase superfamily protein [Clostridium beijerinckii]AYK27035.1 4'-phosphopantetheinyl transferase [Clostridium beijerinckii NRRL B-598]NRT86776.1 4'-phosphopantetheinyl transferase [Clostridium beijerinckii]NSB14141.1 4'-phosphopantetheinyl transferase [Clostridium beijerinckii]NYC72208.1 4'-phosphopantetheinyl transferase [Clostridium beijerinckii]OOM30493.1 4'-phosphopantetheinyl transferase sfp [Clostridium beijerinckii]